MPCGWVLLAREGNEHRTPWIVKWGLFLFMHEKEQAQKRTRLQSQPSPLLGELEGAGFLRGHKCHRQAMLDGVGIGVRLRQLLRGTFEVRTGFLDVVLELRVVGVQLLVKV